MKVDKQNGNICYNDEEHIYWNEKDNGKYISVTTLIGKYEQPYDKEFWSAYKALEKLLSPEAWKIEKPKLLDTYKFDKSVLDMYDISENDFNEAQQDILDEWDKTNRESCERGTAIHSKMENMMYKNGGNITFKKLHINGTFDCEKDRVSLDLQNGVYPEYLLHYESPDGLVRIAGQTDLLIKNGNDIYIGDYKGLPLDTEIITSKGWKTIASVKEGDIIYDEDGNPTKIIHKSEIHNNPCYKIIFDNNDEIISDHEHRWKISFKNNGSKGYSNTIMTTEELYNYMQSYNRNSYTIPKVLNTKGISGVEKNLLIDPYVLGAWLGDGSKSCGIITQAKGSPLWDEIKKRGFEISDNDSHNPDRENTEMRTVYGLRTLLNKYNLLMNKHIPNEYYTASYEQRLDLLRGFMDTDGYYHPKRKRFVMSTGQEWQRDCMVKLLGTLGIKATVFSVTKKCGDKKFNAWDVCFSTLGLNPFLIRNQDIEYPSKDNCTFRNIDKIEIVDTIPTQCLEVDSPKHTFLCTDKCIVTHNTNKKIELKSFYDKKLRRTKRMKYPLTDLDDVNFWHYTMQLSMYAWMVQQMNPEFEIKKLYLIHYDHNNKQTIYECDYLKDKVEALISHYGKNVKHEQELSKYERIEY